VTHDEYVQVTVAALLRAQDGRDLAATFRDADEALARSDFNDAEKRAFWASVNRALQSSKTLTEKQANSALVALMQAIQQGIAARATKA
jgi:hypothetical protein